MSIDATANSAVPVMSIVVPAYRCAAQLEQCLQALHGSTLPAAQREIIVVDDGSGDGTAHVAIRLADRVLSVVTGPQGPAQARNAGALAARGELVLFVDADVTVAPETPALFVELFAREPELAAAFGSYDSTPAASGFVSQYRNLLHHVIHTRNAGPSQTFWSGCGAVRRQHFIDVGGFDALRYPRPSVEDIELGYRLSDCGYRILLAPQLQGKHLKRWTFRSMVATDFHARAVPWMQLLLERTAVAGNGPLNVQRREKLVTAATALASVALVAALVLGHPVVAGAMAVALLLFPLADPMLLRAFARARGVAFALAVIPMRTIFYLVSATGAVWAILTYRARQHGHVVERTSEVYRVLA